MFSNKKTIIY